MSTPLVWIVLGCAFSRSRSVEPADRVTLEVAHASYEIRGGSVEALRASLDAHRPRDPTGAPYDAVTTWFVEWAFTYAPTPDGRCRMTSASSRVDVRDVLPRWVDADAGAPALRERWRAYRDALATHERGHRDIAVRTANAIQRRLADLVAADCSVLHARADAAAQALLERGRSEERAYDRRTDHGRSRGARFGR